MARREGAGHIGGFLKKAEKAIDSALEQGIEKADDILDNAVVLGKMTAAEAQRRSAGLRQRAKEESSRIISERRAGSSGRTDALEALAKLGELRKAKVITDAEFRAKKKKLLDEV